MAVISRRHCARLASLAVFASLPSLYADTVNYWINAGTASWHTAGNWSAGVPTSLQEVDINNGGTAQITGTALAHNLYVGKDAGESGFLTIAGTCSIQTEVIGNSGTGTVTQSAGTNGFSPITLSLGYNSTGNGTYALSNGTLQASVEYVGYGGTGTFTQTGGTHTVNQFIMANDATGSGSFALSSGSLSVTTGAIGYRGTASFTQSGGTTTVSSLFQLAVSAGSTGTYTLSSGQLTVNSQELIGSSGNGTFNQSGGTHNIANSLQLGSSGGGSGTYTLSNGDLTAKYAEYIGAAGAGTFTQSGGTHTLTGVGPGDAVLYIATYTGSTGTYSMEGGVLSVDGGIHVAMGGAGSFLQTGGSTTAGTLYVAPGGTASFTSGTLKLTAGLRNDGSLAIGGNVSMDLGGLVDLGHASLGSLGTVSLTSTTANALIILPVGTNTGDFQSYNNPGMTAYAGSPITIPGGTTVAAGKGGTSEFLIVQGTLSGSATLSGGLSVQGGSAAIEDLLVNTINSNMTTGTLSASGVTSIGDSDNGVFDQSGGTHTTGVLYVGYGPGFSGTYTLSGGQLTSNSVSYIGYGGTGTFTQTGGTHTAATLIIASGSSYSLSGGTLNVSSGLISAGGFTLGGTATMNVAGIVDLSQGTFGTLSGVTFAAGANSLVILPAGTNTANFQSYTNPGMTVYGTGAVTIPGGTTVAAGAGGTGIRLIVAGTLTGSAALTGGIAVQGSGNATVASLRTDGATASTVSGGQLAITANEYIGHTVSGTFNQAGGRHTIGAGQGSFSSAVLYLGYTAGVTGTYTLSSGTLAVNGTENIGYDGTGSFTQTGGTHNQTGYNNFIMGRNPGSEGTYSLSSGTLSVGGYEYIGYYGAGTFTQSGGMHTLTGASSTGMLTLGQFAGSTGNYTLSDGTLQASLALLGGSGSCHFDQSGGSVSLTSGFTLGAGVGGVSTYTLTGGTLTTTGSSWVAASGFASFLHTAGTVTIGAQLNIATSPGSVGVYTLSDSAILSAAALFVGGRPLGAGQSAPYQAGGSGTLSIRGGNTTMTGQILIISAASRVELIDGALSSGSLNIANGTFVQTGGTFSTGPVVSGGTITLTSATLGTVDAVAAGTSSTALSAVGSMTLSTDAAVTALRVRQAALTVQGDATYPNAKLTLGESSPGLSTGTPSGNDAMVSIVRTLSIDHAGADYFGTVDVANNDLIIEYTGASSPLAAIEAMIKSGYNAGTWGGRGITSSVAAGNSGAYALVVLDNAQRPTPFTTFDGVGVPTTVVIVKFSWIADLDLDGVITSNDAIVFANNYVEGQAANHRLGDLNYNGVFDSNDAILFANAYNESLPHLPEPASVGMLAAGAGMLLMRRRAR